MRKEATRQSMFFNIKLDLKKGASVNCPVSAMFAVLEDDLKNGLCTDISFKYNGKKHSFGAYGDRGETRKNVKFYCDKFECKTVEELKTYTLTDGLCLSDTEAVITVLDCNGCYPKSTPILAAYLSEDKFKHT